MGEAKYIYFTCLNRSRRETKLNSKGLKNSSITVMSHSGPVIPAFVDLSEAQQASELLVFLKGLGAEVSEEYKPEDGLPGNVRRIGRRSRPQQPHQFNPHDATRPDREHGHNLL